MRASEAQSPTEPRTATDPYRRRSPVTESTVRVVGTAAVLWGLMYLAWRLLATGDGTSPLLFWPLLIAEAMGWLGLVLLLTQTWNLPDRSWSRRRPNYTADVIVTSYNDPIADVRTSLLGAMSVAGVSVVVLADDGGRNELRELAHRLDVAYVQRGSTEGARAGNINELLPRLSSDLVVLLAAGQAAMPDLLTATDRYFDDPDVAVVVCGSRDASRTRITHSADDRHEQALDSEVIVPGLDRSGTLPWIEGPAVVRRDAVLKVGGLASGTQTPEYQTGLRMQRRGMLIRHHAETLCETHDPQSVEALMRLRERSTLGRWSSIRTADSPLWASGLSMGARLGHASVLIRPTMAVQKVLMIGVLIATLFAGALPLEASVYELAFLAVPYLVLAGAGRVILGRGRLEPGDWTKQDLRYMGVHLTALGGALFGRPSRFRYVPKDPTADDGVGSLSSLRLLTGLLIALVAAMAFRSVAITVHPGSLRGLTAVVAFGLAGWLVVQMMDVLGMLSRHRQRRRRYRVLTDMQAVLDDIIVNVLDISPLGMGLETSRSYDLGNQITVLATLADATGSTQMLELPGVIRHSSEIEERSTWRVGVEFTGLSATSSDLLIWFCAVAHPFHSLRRGVEVPLLTAG